MFNTVDLFLHNKLLTSAEIGNGAVFTCPFFSFALIWGENTIYVVDVMLCSEGVHVPNGQAVLLEFRTLNVLNSYVMKYYEKYFLNKHVLQYDIQYTTIKLSEESINSVLAILRIDRKSLKDPQIKEAWF